MAVSGSGEIKLRDIYNEQQESTGEPSANTHISMDTLADSYGANAASTVTARATLSGDQDKITDFYGAIYPGTFNITLMYRGSLFSNELLDTTTPTNADNQVMIEGETFVPFAISTTGLVGTDNATFEVVTQGGAAVSPTQTDDSNTLGSLQFAGNIVLGITTDTQDGEVLKFKVTDTNNPYNTNFSDRAFKYYDDIDTHTTSEIGPAGSLSANKIMYVSAEDESVGDIVTSHTTTIGNIRSSSYSNAINENGDGGNINYSEGNENQFTIGNTPGKMTFTYTHWNYPYHITNGGSRNTSTNTAVLDIRYTRAIDSISRNASTFNSGDSVTISATGEGVSGTHTMKLGYHKTEANDDFTSAVDESVLDSLYLRQDETENFTLSLTSGTVLKTFYPKALYTSGVSNRVTGAAFTLAPAYSYSTTGNTTINVSTTQVFAVSSVIGYNSAVVITSSPNIGGGTDSATMTPLLKTGTFTITFNAAADYGQNGASYDQTDVLSVDPTVSLVLTDSQVGDNIPINDAHSDTIASATHGVVPTVFTHTPTVAGTLQNGHALTYLWTIAALNFTYTSGGTATAGAVSFKKNSSGTLAHTLLVTGDNDRDATASNGVVCKIVTKTVSGASSDTLRIGTTFTVTSISTAYTQTVALYRQAADDGYYKIANGVSVAGTIHFSMTGDAWIPDSTARTVRLVDDDNTGIVDSLGSFAILNPLAVINGFTAAQTTTLGAIYLEWTTTGATTVSINQSVGVQGSMDGNTTDTGNSNDDEITYTLTAGNANSETVTAQATATTITPSLSFGDPSTEEWTWGDTGNVSILINKNFADELTGHMGYSLNATPGGGTELQTITAGNGSTGNITLTFDKNKWDYQSSLGSAIVDFRGGHLNGGWIVSNNSATVIDFTGPNAATSFSATGTSGTGIQISWTNPSGTFTGVKVYGAEVGLGKLLLTTVANGQTPSFAHSGLNGDYEYYLQTYYSRTADSTTRTKTVNTANFQGSTIGWDSHLVYGTSFLVTQGTGYTNQEDAYHHASSESRTLYHLDTTTLGTHTVSMRRSVDGGTYSGNNTWFATGEGPDVFYLTTSANVTAANYILEANVQPDSPTGADATAHNVLLQITITWACTSTIETGFKIYRSTSSPPTNSGSPIVTLGANVVTYTNTGLDADQIYYYSVYSYHGTAYGSSASSDSDTTAVAVAWGTAPPDFGLEGIPFQTVTSGAKSITITGADTSSNGTTVSCTGGVAVALSQSAGSGYGSFLASSSITTTSSDTIYAKFRFTFPKAGVHVDFNSDVTYENGGITNTNLDISVDASLL